MLKIYAIEASREERHEAARKLLKWKYEELWKRPMPEILVAEDGKPCFADGNAHFSFSYTDGWAFCALSDGPVGLDVETVRSASPNTVRGVLSREEWMQYSVASNPALCFMQFWTLKEAYCKFTGKGIAGTNLREISFSLSGKNPICRTNTDLFFWQRNAGNLVISVCSASNNIPEFYKEEI